MAELQSLINFSKTWPNTVFQTGIGLLGISILESVATQTNQDGLFSSYSFSLETVPDAGTIASAFLFFVAAFVTGTTIQAIGEFFLSEKEGRKGNVRRDIRVFQTGNALLIQRYQKNLFHWDVFCGFFGVALFLLASSPFLPDAQISDEDSFQFWIRLLIAASIAVGVFLLRDVARQPFRIIDQVLDEIDQIKQSSN